MDTNQKILELRKQAEDKITADLPLSGGLDAKKLLHELQVHHVELEMQNAELQQQVEKLALEKQKFRIVADNTYDWEFWTAPDGTFLYNSPSCKRISGYPPERFNNNTELYAQIIHPDDLEIYRIHHDNFAEAHLEGEVDFRIIRADGEVRWIAHVCKPVWGDGGDYLGIRGSNRDITERMVSRLDLMRTKELAEAANRAKSEYEP